MRPEYDIDERKLLFQFFRLARLLRHTAAHRDQKIFFGFFEFFQGADVSISVIFRVFADTAGIKDDDIRVFAVSNRLVAHLFQRARDFFRFVHVHLTAVCNDMIMFLVHNFP